jgi:hypothetical protein
MGNTATQVRCHTCGTWNELHSDADLCKGCSEPLRKVSEHEEQNREMRQDFQCCADGFYGHRCVLHLALFYWAGMSTFTRSWFLIIVAAALLNRYYIRPSGLEFIDQYLNDVLSMPILLQLSLGTLRLLSRAPEKWLNGVQVMAAWIQMSLFFELIFPLIRKDVYADWFDVLAYLFGAGIYWLIQKTEISRAANLAG